MREPREPTVSDEGTVPVQDYHDRSEQARELQAWMARAQARVRGVVERLDRDGTLELTPEERAKLVDLVHGKV